MDVATISQLNLINTHFYETVADEFAASRKFFWKGWEKLLPHFQNEQELSVLDVGCGTGRFGEFLTEKVGQEFTYTGVDNNEKLLKIAQKKNIGSFIQIDIVEALLNDKDFLPAEKFTAIAAFGILHHIPSQRLRKKFISTLASHLQKNGYLFFTTWQFNQDKNLLKRQEKAGRLRLEPNDYVLNWERGKHAVRYCHLTTDEEAKELISASGLQFVESYRADSQNTYFVSKLNR